MAQMIDCKGKPVFVNGLFCKDPMDVKAKDFFFSGLNIPGNTSNAVGSFVTPVTVFELPGLNTLGISSVRIDYAPKGLNPPHTHPRATEILTVIKGKLFVGFVTSNPDNRLFTKLLCEGDVFVFPMGLIHFQFNVGKTKAVALASLSSQNPGVITIANAVFGSNPLIKSKILEIAFQVDKKLVEKLQSQFWFDNWYYGKGDYGYGKGDYDCGKVKGDYDYNYSCDYRRDKGDYDCGQGKGDYDRGKGKRDDDSGKGKGDDGKGEGDDDSGKGKADDGKGKGDDNSEKGKGDDNSGKGKGDDYYRKGKEKGKGDDDSGNGKGDDGKGKGYDNSQLLDWDSSPHSHGPGSGGNSAVVNLCTDRHKHIMISTNTSFGVNAGPAKEITTATARKAREVMVTTAGKAKEVTVTTVGKAREITTVTMGNQGNRDYDSGKGKGDDDSGKGKGDGD
ncbi:hypothetical protein LguiB_004694 [Lonicera macranthoides]